MIDHDLSHQLHSLAATVDEPLDLAALHRRISAYNRRRTATRVGFAGAGVAAVVGGLFVVTNERSAPSQSGFASAPVGPTAVPTESAPAIEDPSALPDCATVLAEIAARPTTDSEVPKDVPADPASADELGAQGFKGIVTITAIEGPQVSFDVDEPALTAVSSGIGVVDDATEWVDGETPLTTPPALAVGQQLGLATRQDGAGVDHVIFADVSAIPSEAHKDDSKPVIDSANLSDDELKKAVEAAEAASAEDKAPEGTSEGANVSVPGEPTEKASATITAADATTVTASLEDPLGQPATATIDIATTTFYADQTVCSPGVLTVGDEIGIAYHLDEGDTIVVNAVMLVP